MCVCVYLLQSHKVFRHLPCVSRIQRENKPECHLSDFPFFKFDRRAKIMQGLKPAQSQALHRLQVQVEINAAQHDKWKQPKQTNKKRGRKHDKDIKYDIHNTEILRKIYRASRVALTFTVINSPDRSLHFTFQAFQREGARMFCDNIMRPRQHCAKWRWSHSDNSR